VASGRQAALAAGRGRACERGARARAQAIRVYDRLRAQGLSPNSTTYNALITAHGKACNLEMARVPAPLPCPGLPAGLSNKNAKPGFWCWWPRGAMPGPLGALPHVLARPDASTALVWKGLHAGVRCAWCFMSRTVHDGHAVASWAAEQRTDTPDERSRACDLSMARSRLQTWDGQAGAWECDFETPPLTP